MRAIEIATPGPPEVLRVVERAVPAVGHGELLIAVAAAGVNRPDVVQRQGRYPPPPGVTDIPGLEVAGHVAGIGTGVSGWALGDPICALVAGGGYAEYCLAPVEQCLPLPRGLTFTEAAALPETCCTVWTNLVDRGRLQAGEWLLVHGGSSGIGTTAIQVGRLLGARVTVTAGTAEKCRACEAIGAEQAWNYREVDWVQAARELTGDRGVDVVLDMVGGEYTARNLDVLATEGRLVQIAFLKGSRVELDLMQVMGKRLTVTGSTLRPRSPAEKGQILQALHSRMWPALEARDVRPVIDSVFPLERAADAHRLMEQSTHVGKIVLQVAP